jgi:hypothetical protein
VVLPANNEDHGKISDDKAPLIPTAKPIYWWCSLLPRAARPLLYERHRALPDTRFAASCVHSQVGVSHQLQVIGDQRRIEGVGTGSSTELENAIRFIYSAAETLAAIAVNGVIECAIRNGTISKVKDVVL